MKILTLQFLTCAVKTCKSKSLSSSTFTKNNNNNNDNDSTTSSSPPFPLHPLDASLERSALPFNPTFILNILPRLDFPALRTTATEFGVVALLPPPENPLWETIQDGEWRSAMLGRVQRGDIKIDQEETEDGDEDVEMKAEDQQQQQQQEEEEEGEEIKVLRNLHTLLLETEMVEGKLRCGSCGHEYGVREGVGNFLLPAHLV